MKSCSGSFYVASKHDVQNSVTRWKALLPSITPYYAVKSNHSTTLLEWLHDEGVRFDCASVGEIKSVLDIGVSPGHIVYANPCKARSDLIFAKDVGVQQTVVDSVEEIDKLVEERWPGDALLRIRVDDTKSVVPFSRKFGLPLAEVNEVSKYAAQKLPLSGISFHVGSGCQEASQYTRAILQAAECIEILRDNHHSAHTIDIGGGFTQDGFASSAAAIQKAIQRIPKDITMIAEPGRYFSEGSHTLFVKVIGKKRIHGGSGFRYTLDESLYGQFSCIPFDCAKPRWIRVGGGKRNSTPAILFGRTCDSVDMIAMTGSTEELMEGDWLVFPNMGAYTSVTSSEFNGFPRPPVLTVGDSMSYLIPKIPHIDIQYVSPVTTPLTLMGAHQAMHKSQV